MDYASETLTGRASVRPAVIDTYFCVWALQCYPKKNVTSLIIREYKQG